jgi:hypothetical protein
MNPPDRKDGETRLLIAAVALHGLLSSPQLYEVKNIVRDSVKVADALLKELEDKAP